MADAKPDRGIAPPVGTAQDDEPVSAAYLAYRAAEAVVGAVPRSLAYAMGAAGAETLTRLRPRRYTALRNNLRQALPDVDDAELERILRANVRNIARCWVDVMEMPHRPRQIMSRLDVVSGFDSYKDALARGHGVVAVSLHLGAWESGLAAWNQAGGGLALFAERIRPERMFQRIAGGRASMGVKNIPVDAAAMRGADRVTARRHGAAAMRDVVRHLRGGGTIAIAMDRDITGGGEMLEFFGRPAPIPVGTVDVAIRCGAAVVPVVLIRAGRRTHGYLYPEVTYDPDAPRDGEVRRVASEILSLFETVIRDNPTMWHVLDPIWPEASA